ncbi:putative phage tail fiber protein [Rhizobium phage RHph_TM39]|nr:putative phage tail fiber protein [Rhizobium phage RHph_TM39]
MVTSVAGSGNYALKSQAIEGVHYLANKTVTLTFYAKADTSRNIAVEFYQSFGSGGSPSAAVSIPLGLVALTSSWKKYTIVTSLPSISGKTLGSDGNHSLILGFWFDAGSTFAARASNLGQQSGTFDLSHVSVVEGDAQFETDPFSARPITQEIMLCQRYYGKVMYHQVLHILKWSIFLFR